jgi:3-oxoadipate enol-lactonase
VTGSTRGPLVVHRQGVGPRVVLGHALGLDRTSVQDLADRLSARAEVVLWEAPGHGGVPSAAGPWSHADLAAELAADLRALGPEPVVAVGISQGAYVSMHLALDHPDLVRALVLVSCEAAAPPPELTPARLAEIAVWRRDGTPKAAALDRAERNFGPSWPGRLAWADRWVVEGVERYVPAYDALFARPDLRDRLAGVDCPALVLRGEGDPWVGADGAAELVAHLPRGEGPVTIDGGHHNPQVVRPDETADLVLGFLARLGPS